jgi:hypothetical protein
MWRSGPELVVALLLALIPEPLMPLIRFGRGMFAPGWDGWSDASRATLLVMGSLSSFAPEPVRLDLCYSCGHLETSHHDPLLPCGASVSTRPEGESYWREPCPCKGCAPMTGTDVGRSTGSG